MGNDKQSLYTIITPEQAKKQNQRETAGGSNSEYMSFKGDPRYPSEYFSPEELDASVVKAFKSKEEEEAFKRKQLEKQVATMMNAYDWKRPLATRGPNQGDTSLQNIAAASIGAPLLLLNPATSTIATGPIAHAIEVAMNPLAAETMLGAFLGTGAQAAGITAGIYNASNTIDKWRNGNFDLYDIPYFALDAASTIPVFNTVAGLADDAVRMTQNAYRTQRAARNATKPMTHGDPGLAQDYINAAGNADALNESIINQQLSGKLQSHHPSKLTEAEKMGIPRGERNNIDNGSYMKRWLWRSGKKFGVDQDSFTKAILKHENSFLKEIDDGYIDDNTFYSDLNAWFKQPYSPVSQGYDSNNPIIIRLKKYAKTLPDDMEIHPMYRTVSSKLTGEVETPFIEKFRNYYFRILDLPRNALSTKEIQKIATVREKLVNAGVTGKFKEVPLIHSSSSAFDKFDFPNSLGKNTKNSGAHGPGNYFYANGISEYGGSKKLVDQPFYVTGIKSVLSRDLAGSKGLIGHYTSNVSSTGIPKYPSNGKYAFISGGLENPAPMGHSAFFDPYFSSPEVAIPKNTGIKSLFPHPDMIVELPDGTFIQKAPDWNDIRFNFKNGGRLLKIENPDQ